MSRFIYSKIGFRILRDINYLQCLDTVLPRAQGYISFVNENSFKSGGTQTYIPGYCIGDRCVKPSLRDGYATLKLGEQLISKNGKYDLRMQTDGNLVVYCNGNALWHSETYGRSVTGGLRFQGDSNLVIYDPNPIWHSSTYDSGATTLIMQDDGNAVLYTREGRSVWHTGTFGMC